jgi:hypothetical protein
MALGSSAPTVRSCLRSMLKECGKLKRMNMAGRKTDLKVGDHRSHSYGKDWRWSDASSIEGNRCCTPFPTNVL